MVENENILHSFIIEDRIKEASLNGYTHYYELNEEYWRPISSLDAWAINYSTKDLLKDLICNNKLLNDCDLVYSKDAFVVLRKFSKAEIDVMDILE